MTVVLQARIEHPPSWLRGMKPTSPEAVSSFNSFTNAYGRRVALAAQGRMSNMLRRKHRYEIGATEKAANNIEVAPGRMGKSFTSWDVVEGGLTPANEIIRSGMGPVQVKIETLYKWAIIKQLQLREYGEDATQARRIRYTKSRMDDPRHRDRPSHAYRKRVRGSRLTDEQIVLGALYRIRSALKTYGTERAPTATTRGANWFPRYPTGKGRFDYVTYVTKMDSTFSQAVRDADRFAERAVIEFLRTGRTITFNTRTYIP